MDASTGRLAGAQLSDLGLIALARHEGIALGSYRDSRGIWTSGIGHTAGAGGPDPAKAPRIDSRPWGQAAVDAALHLALRQFRTDLLTVEGRVRAAITHPLAGHQFDALVSFDFNTGGIHRARLTRAINRGDLSGAGFMGWIKPPEIIARRKAEQTLFQTGDYGRDPAIPIYDVLGDGRLLYRQSLPAAALLALMAVPQPLVPSPPGWLRGIRSVIAAAVRLVRGIGA